MLLSPSVRSLLWSTWLTLLVNTLRGLFFSNYNTQPNQPSTITAETHTHTHCQLSPHHPAAIIWLTEPLVRSSQPIPHLLLFRLLCNKSQITLSPRQTTETNPHPPRHLDIMHCRHPPQTYTRPITFLVTVATLTVVSDRGGGGSVSAN